MAISLTQLFFPPMPMPAAGLDENLSLAFGGMLAGEVPERFAKLLEVLRKEGDLSTEPDEGVDHP